MIDICESNVTKKTEGILELTSENIVAQPAADTEAGTPAPEAQTDNEEGKIDLNFPAGWP